jgi:uncharacterized protein YqhQ
VELHISGFAVEEILAKLLENAPEILSSFKEIILKEFGPAGLMIAMAAILAVVVYSVISLVKFLFKVVMYIILPALVIYIILQVIDPSLLKSF